MTDATREKLSIKEYSSLVIAAVLVAGTALWLILLKWQLGVRGEWAVIPHDVAWPIGAWGLPLATFFIFGGFSAICAYDRIKRAKNRREQIASTRLCLLGIFILAFAWPWSLLGPVGTSNLINAHWSDVANEYFGMAYQIEDARTFTSEFAATRQHPESRVQAHVATHPPGAVLFYYGARRVYEAIPLLQNVCSGLAASLTNETLAALAVRSNELRRTASRSAGIEKSPPNLPFEAVGGALWASFLVALLLASAVPAIYLVASSRGKESTPEESAAVSAETRGLVAAALWALAPTVNLFTFTLDAVIAAGTAWTLVFIALRLRGGKIGWSLAAGASLALTSFISFGALAAGVIVLIAQLCLYWNKKKVLLGELLVIAVAFALTWLFLMTIFPMRPHVIFTQAMEVHRTATVAVRSQFGWTWFNLLTFAVFCGWPIVVVICAAFVQVFRRLAEGGAFKLWSDVTIPSTIGFAGVLVVLLLDVSGKALGEVERLWMFLLVPLCVLAAVALMRRNVVMIGGILLLQAVQTLLMAAYLAPLVLPV